MQPSQQPQQQQLRGRVAQKCQQGERGERDQPPHTYYRITAVQPAGLACL